MSELEQALALHRAGDTKAAEVLYRELTQSKTQQQYAAWHAWGVLCYQQQRFTDAVNCFGKALELKPNSVDDLNNYALALRGMGCNNAALDVLQRALQHQADDPDIFLNLANTFLDLERLDEAAHYYRKLWQISQNEDIWQTLIDCLTRLGNSTRAGQALGYWQELLQLNSQDATLHYNLGNTLRALGRPAEALGAYQNALNLNPKDADTHNNLGNTLRELGAIPEAISHYEQAFALQPNLYHAYVHWVHQKQQLCSWQGLDEAILKIRHWVREIPQARIPPFAFLSMAGSEEAEHKLCADHWLAQNYASLLSQAPLVERIQHRQHHNKCITLAYLSADFRQHPLASLITEVIEGHDRKRFRVLGVSTTMSDHSTQRMRFEQAFDDLIDIHDESDETASQLIKNASCDILIDLSGFTQNGRSGLAILRPAPVMVNWLGYAGTLGQKPNSEPLFDYLLADAIVIPEAARQYYAEKVLYLPHCYQPHNQSREVAITLERTQYGLPEQGTVLCAFNQHFKITPTMFALWMRLLKADTDAVLWLLDGHPQVVANLHQAAREAGVGSHRLVFAPRLPAPQHFARHTHADLFLDTLPYNAHTTASDALWMGVPVLTCTGQSFAGRVTSSLLHAANLNEFITKSLEEYENKAIFYMKNPDRLRTIKANLRAHNTPLFDLPAFIKALEGLYRDMV